MNKGYFNPIRNTLLLMFLFFHQNIAYGDVCKDFNKRCPKAQKKSICFLNNFKGRVFKKNHIYCPAFSFNYLNEKKNFNLPKLTEESLKDMAKRCYVAKEITYTGFGHPDDLYSKGPKDYVPNYSGHLVGDFSFVNKYRCLFDKNLQINTPSHLAALGWFGLKGAYKSDCIEAMQAYNLSRHFFHNQRNGTVNIKKSLYTGGTRLTYNLKDRKTAFLSGGEPTEYQETNWQLKPAKMVDICKKDINRQMYDAVEENQRAQRERRRCVISNLDQNLVKDLTFTSQLTDDYETWDFVKIRKMMKTWTRRKWGTYSCRRDPDYKPPPEETSVQQ